MRHTEQQQMQEYVALTTGHMEFLISALDGAPGGSTPLQAAPLPTEPNPVLVHEAVTFLKRTGLPIEPRKMWPALGMPSYGVRGGTRIKERVEPGMALSVWADAGWGEMVKDGKYKNQEFGDDLVHACVAMVRKWDPQPKPSWVTCIPSLRHPRLVRDFAEKLARALELRFEMVLQKTDDRPEQKSMVNSTQQVRNLDGAIELHAVQLPTGAVLLVDDVVDSGWTMTVAG